MKMIDAVIVDDEILVLDLLERLLLQSGDVRIIGKFTDSSEALEEIQRLKPDVIFLDVEMPEINGIELGTRLVEFDNDMDIVFVTAYEQYAIHAFKINAVNYILKPVDIEGIEETIRRLSRIKKREDRPQNKNIHIKLLGDFNIFRKDNSKVKWTTSKVEELFALLIVNGEKGITKWKIIDILWGESQLEKSQQNLYTTIFRLKKTLSDAGIKVSIHNNLGTYCMSLENVFCDFYEFEDFIKKKQQINGAILAEVERVISLYQGDLFGDKYYSWNIDEREFCYQHYVDIVKRLLTFYKENHLTDKLKKQYTKMKYHLSEDDITDIKKMLSIKF